MKYVYCPAGRATWAKVALALDGYGYSPCIWLGDPVHDAFAAENFSTCTVLDFYRTNLGRVDGGPYRPGVFSTYTENRPFFDRLSTDAASPNPQAPKACFRSASHSGFSLGRASMFSAV